MEIRFITTETVNETPKQIIKNLNDLKGKTQALLDYNYLLEPFKLI